MAANVPRRAGARPYRPPQPPSDSVENDPDLDPLPSPSPLPLRTPRSPLVAIPEPSHNPLAAAATTGKSSPRIPGGLTPWRIHRDRGSSFGVSKRLIDFKTPTVVEDDVPLEVPSFDIDEDPSFWRERNVQVLIRIRPLNSMEKIQHGYRRCVTQTSAQSITCTGPPETMFTFDHVAGENISQEKLFYVVGVPMVENCLSGYNSCLFAYGQTGSGKTYTMMGELHDTLSKNRGMTPRIFEHLFARIKEEEASRIEDKLIYTCKCSFLEIYNEHITDLLEPLSANLQLREDIKKGVYVENLMEHEVSSVKDVMELLLQGVANRRIAATNMNSESSRSHSVFTCIIESRWEKDSMAHLRFARLNLVDLAGSERQKSSGAEGDRLKEAANINRSLSTLGLVIMTLVDIANGKTRHVPYRDSRLTFLLQDSLGGNSKTAVIANISPAMCSSSETLSTLKFAQRAKLIQNNAKINKIASGDVMVLQKQIQDLKVHSMESSIQQWQAVLKLREEKLQRLDQRLDLLMDDIVSCDDRFMEEYISLSKEIEILKDQVINNPQLIKFSLENMRLIRQHNMYILLQYMHSILFLFINLAFDTRKHVTGLKVTCSWENETCY